jgi:hypothetical protein
MTTTSNGKKVFQVLSILSVLLSSLLVLCQSTYLNPDLIVSLPGWNGPLPTNMYSGYLEASSTSRLFYWFVESEKVDPKTAPTVVWLNGGPGCSSLDGFFYELGPFQFDSNGNLELRPHRFNLLANMLFIESPVGVGLSYSTVQNYNNDDDRSAAENRDAIKSFFIKFPELKSNHLYLTGEVIPMFLAPCHFILPRHHHLIFSLSLRVMPGYICQCWRMLFFARKTTGRGALILP